MYLGTVVHCRQCGQAVVFGYYRGGVAPYDPYTSNRHFCGAQEQDQTQPLMTGFVDGRNPMELPVYLKPAPAQETQPERTEHTPERTPVRTATKQPTETEPLKRRVIDTEFTLE